MAATASFTLVLICGHQAEHTVWEGVDPEKDMGWFPGMGRWCRTCDRNSTVEVVVDPARITREIAHR